MTRNQIRYLGNVAFTLVIFAALYLLFAHRYSHRPFDYLWQGYMCPTGDFLNCVKDIEPVLLNIHYVDRQVCKKRTESEMDVVKIAENFPDITIDVGFMYGCWRSDFRRSQLTPAQVQKGLVIDDGDGPASVQAPAVDLQAPDEFEAVDR